MLVGTQAEGNALINVQSGGAGAVFDELVSFVPLSLTGSIQTTTAASTTPWLVVDPTGTGNGWHINLNSTDFVSNTNHTIPVNGFEIKIADDNISEIAGNQKPVSNIPVYTVLNPLDTKVVSAAGETGMGSYNFVPEFRLTIPASTYAGNYVATVTSSFISAP